MSFLDERESHAALEDALALVDAYDGEIYLQLPGEDDGSSGQETKRSRRRATASKLPYWDRARAELSRLRHEIEALEAMLARLKKAEQVVSSDDSNEDQLPLDTKTESTRWTEILVREYRLRRESELRNSKLKALAARQARAAAEIQGSLGLLFTRTDIALMTDEPEDAESTTESMPTSAARKTRGTRGPCGIRLLVGIRKLVGKRLLVQQMLVACLGLLEVQRVNNSASDTTVKRLTLILSWALGGRLDQQQQKCRALDVMSPYQMPSASSQLQCAF